MMKFITLLSTVLSIPAHFVGICYGAIKAGFVAGVQRFEDTIEQVEKDRIL